MPGIIGLVLMLSILGLALAVVMTRSMAPRLKAVLTTALLLRPVGTVAYVLVFTTLYRGSDAGSYFATGLGYAQRMWAGDFAMFTQSSNWAGGRFWGTNFVRLAAAVTTSVLGGTKVGNFLVFSLLAFLGLMAFALAFRREFPLASLGRYVAWVGLFPSLWFWPAGIGKDALLLCGLGIATMGFVGEHRRIRWIPLLAGLGLIAAVRPQVMAVVAFSMICAQWLARPGRWTPRRLAQSIIFLVVGLVIVRFALGSAGAGGLDPEEVQTYLTQHAAHAAQGRSAIDVPTGTGFRAAPVALLNVFFRPFPWEGRNVTSLVASLEIWCFWLLAFYQRRNIRNAIAKWRESRLVAMSLIFVVLYSASLGLVVANLGIIGRQRICIFPCLFVLFEAVPAKRAFARRLARRPLYAGVVVPDSLAESTGA